jgi:hypothetical protein
MTDREKQLIREFAAYHDLRHNLTNFWIRQRELSEGTNFESNGVRKSRKIHKNTKANG